MIEPVLNAVSLHQVRKAFWETEASDDARTQGCPDPGYFLGLHPIPSRFISPDVILL